MLLYVISRGKFHINACPANKQGLQVSCLCSSSCATKGWRLLCRCLKCQCQHHILARPCDASFMEQLTLQLHTLRTLLRRTSCTITCLGVTGKGLSISARRPTSGAPGDLCEALPHAIELCPVLTMQDVEFAVSCCTARHLQAQGNDINARQFPEKAATLLPGQTPAARLPSW